MIAIILSAISGETVLNEAVEAIDPVLTQKSDWETVPDKLEALPSIIGDHETPVAVLRLRSIFSRLSSISFPRRHRAMST